MLSRTRLLGVKRSSIVLTLLAALALAATGYVLFAPGRGLPDAPLRAMPADIHGFARVRVARVLASRAYREIVIDRKEDRGIQRVIKICGFNPLSNLNEVFAFALRAPGKREIVVNARGAIERSKWIDCVTKYAGGSAAGFQYEQIAGFAAVRDKKGTARAAFIGRDGLVAGRAEGVRATLESLAGRRPNAESEPQLRELYAALSEDSEIALAARLPSDAKQRAQLAASLGLEPGALPSELRAGTIDLHLVADLIRCDVQLWLPDAQRARALADNIEQTRREVLALPGLGLVGIAPALRELRVEPSGAQLKLHAELRASTVNRLVDFLPAFAAMQQLSNPGATHTPGAP